MRRCFPSPLLSLALLPLWLSLNQSLSLGNLLLGTLLAWLAPLLMAPLRPMSVRIRRPGVIARFICRVGVDVVVSNLHVARLLCSRRAPRSAFVKIPLELHDPAGLSALAMVTTVIPGTVWSELALDRRMLLMHVFDLQDEARFIEHFKATYERPLMEIFQ